MEHSGRQTYRDGKQNGVPGIMDGGYRVGKTREWKGQTDPRDDSVS